MVYTEYDYIVKPNPTGGHMGQVRECQATGKLRNGR